MATILVVDDRPTNRQFLITLLAYVGHRMVEASDGIEALEVARAEQPDLMIVDILMPRMDGVEFVRQLRKESRFDSSMVMFYTATYHLSEAEKMARKVGVTHLLQKPAEPEAILEAVDSALKEASESSSGSGGRAGRATMHRSPIDHAKEWQIHSIRLNAIIELALDLAIEGDPQKMIDTACCASRTMCDSAYAAAGILHEGGPSLRLFAWDRATSETDQSPAQPPPSTDVLAEVVKLRHPVRLGNDDADLTPFAPPGHRPVRSLLAIPLATTHRVLGWLYVIDKAGDRPFNDEDERLLSTIGGFVAMVYDNMRVVALEQLTSELRQSQEQLQHANATLERRVAQRTAELKDSVDQLEKKNAELDQFAYVASHDLQEPLRKLLSFGQLLEQDLDGELNEQAASDLHYITDAARRMQKLVQDLLALSRAGQSAMHQEEVDLNDCADRALESLSSRVEETGAEIIRDPLPHAVGDQTTLTLLYQNLIGNALKFVSGHKPVVHLTAESIGDEFTFGVRDNGIGIDPEYAKHIFEPFRRLHGRNRYGGTGIGLAICRKTVERHGGRIWIESEPGLGSHFKFTLSNLIKPPQQDSPSNAAVLVGCED